MMIKRYKIIGRGGGWVFEVIEPSNIDWKLLDHPHSTFMSLSDANGSEYYGTVRSRRSDRISSDQLIGLIADVLGWDWLLDLGTVRIWDGELTVWPDNE
jgi:hypothetical protein